MKKAVATGMFCFTVGFACGDLVKFNKELICNDFTTSNSIWRGYTSERNNDIRCFYLEQYYPYRVRQGLPVIKEN
jgi:hypothetical protein